MMQLYCINKKIINHELLGDKNVDLASHYKYPDVLILFFSPALHFYYFRK